MINLPNADPETECPQTAHVPLDGHKGGASFWHGILHYYCIFPLRVKFDTFMFNKYFVFLLMAINPARSI